MWVFDGEEWTEEGVSEKAKTSEVTAIPFDKFAMPELQIIEITPVTTPKPVPPFPMP
jgi:hypothetical protein